MNDKTTLIRRHILEQLNSGKLKTGDRLASARQLSQELGAAFAIIQNALTTLARDGILEIVARQGVYIRQGWQERLLANNFHDFYAQYTWYQGLREIITSDLPAIETYPAFDKGMFEIRPTIAVQQNHDQYLDLAPLFELVYPDQSLFFSTPLKSFKSGSKLFGIPFIFSPRVIIYNAELFKAAACPCPGSSWTWHDFTAAIDKLKAILPGEKIFNWRPQINMWMNFVLRAGGTIIDPEADDIVQLDKPATRHGLALYTELAEKLGQKPNLKEKEYMTSFVKGEAAMAMMPREVLPMINQSELRDWRTVTLPTFDNGRELTTQATDVLCIRKECIDLELATAFIRIMLSEQVQDYIAAQQYGIPIRKSSAFKSFNLEDQRDMIFLNESTKMSADYQLGSPEVRSLIEKGIEQIWSQNLDIAERTSELANALRVIFKIKGQDLIS